MWEEPSESKTGISANANAMDSPESQVGSSALDCECGTSGLHCGIVAPAVVLSSCDWARCAVL